MMNVVHPTARELADRFCPDTGVPARLGQVWPPRLVVHDVEQKGNERTNEVIASVYVRHHVKTDLEVVIRPGNAPAHDPNGQPVPGLTFGRSARTVQVGEMWQLMPITIQWTPEMKRRLAAVPWIRKELRIELKDGRATRTFRWYAYFTPGPPALPRHASLYDDHPHYHWVDHQGAPLAVPGVSERWIELPAPMSSPALTPACWVQAVVPGPPGPNTLKVVPSFPIEPAVPVGQEVAGWNGALGGHDRRPMLLPLGLSSSDTGSGWSARLPFWDTPVEGHPPMRSTQPTSLEPPTPCVWPRVLSAETKPIDLHQIREPTRVGCDVLLNVSLRLPDDAEPVRVSHADILLGSQVIGTWNGPLDIYAGREWSLGCRVDQDRIAEVGHERLKLTFVFHGRPSRGVCEREQTFSTQNGPYVQIRRARVQNRSKRPWLVIDLGTEGTCAAVAFFDGFARRVLTIPFAEGPIHPSRVYVAPGQGGAWTLTDQPGEEALYTTGIKMGLRLGDGAHPGCPDHVSALEVARFYLRRFLLELRERAAWFPLEACDVLVSFPPRLVCMPRFTRSLREVFDDVVPEVLWPSGRHGRIQFREEAFLVAMPSLYKDLQLSPLPPMGSRFYWVMDFGGGTTDICGFLCSADEYAEEHTISHFTYPQRFPHHLSGNDVTAAFYDTLRRHLDVAGMVAGSHSATGSRHFVFPSDPFPTTRSTHTALLNQTALRELAGLLKCTPTAAQEHLTVVEVAKTLRATTLRSIDHVATTLVALLSSDARTLGDRSVRQLHTDVLDPAGSGVAAESRVEVAVEEKEGGRTQAVPCSECGRTHQLPLWVFNSGRPFRFRCSDCKANQSVEIGQRKESDGEDASPTLLADRPSPAHLLLKQDHQNYRVPDWSTVRRWVKERRVGPEDRVSESGVVWDRLRERPELTDLFDDLPAGTPQPVRAPDTDVGPLPREDLPWAGEIEGLGTRVEKFLGACRAALKDAVRRVPTDASPEVVVLLAGRGSQFQPIAEGVHATLEGRVLHLTNGWVQKMYGDTGTIDPTAGLKTLTVNGGGLYALNQSNEDTSHLMLRFDTRRLDCHTYLNTGDLQPWWLTDALDLTEGGEMPAIRGEDVRVGEHPPLPTHHPIVGEIQLQIEGLPEDRVWEPWVTIARGTVRRVDGQRPRSTEHTKLIAGQKAFTLTGLSEDQSIELLSLLPTLDLLGEVE